MVQIDGHTNSHTGVQKKQKLSSITHEVPAHVSKKHTNDNKKNEVHAVGPHQFRSYFSSPDLLYPASDAWL